MNIALEYRQTFHRDVFIDLLGYRKYGHNEGDEPKFTQPKLYKAIGTQLPRDIYLERLLADGSVTAEEAEAMKQSCSVAWKRDSRKQKPWSFLWWTIS